MIRAGAADPGYAAALIALDPASVVVVPILIAGKVEGIFACARSLPRPRSTRQT